MGVESVGVEAAPYGSGRFPYLSDHINRQSAGSFAEGLESAGLKYWAGANLMGPHAFGSSMATQTGERSGSEGSHSVSQNPSDFGFTGATSPSSTDGGFASRTVSVSELLAFRSRGGKVSGKQTPNVRQDFTSTTPSFSGLNFSSSGSDINGPTNAASSAFSNALPKVVNTGPAPVADVRESSAAAPKDSKYATSSFSAFTTGLKPSTAAPFVFTAGASDTGTLKSGAQTNGPPGRLLSGSSRPVSQSNVSSDGLFSGVSRPGVQSSAAFDSSTSGSSGPAPQTNASKETSFFGPSQPTVQSNVFSDNLFSAPSRPSALASSSTESSYVGSSNSSFFKSMGQADASFEDLLAASAARGVGGGVSKPTTQRNRFAETDQGISVGISRQLNQLEIDKGIEKGVSLLPKLKTLDLNKDGEKILKPSVFSAEIEVGKSLKNLDIDKGDSLPLKMERLTVNKEGKNAPSGKSTFVFGTQHTSASGHRTPIGVPFVFGVASAPARAAPAPAGASNFSQSTVNQSSETPPAPAPAPAFKFSADGEAKAPVFKAKKDKLQHRPFRPGQKSGLRGKKSTSANSSRRSEAATPSPSRDGVSMDISPESTNGASTSSQSGQPGFHKSLVPEYGEGNSDEESGGASEVNSMNELEASMFELGAAVSELNFGAGLNRAKETSSSTTFPDVKEQETCLGGNESAEEASNSASYGQGWKRTSVTDTEFVEIVDQENESAGRGDRMNDMNDMNVRNFDASNLGADRNEDGPETSSGPDTSFYFDESQQSAGGEARVPTFTFTASPTGMSTSSLRRRSRKAQRSIKAERASIPVLQPNKTESRPLSTIKSGTWSGTAPIAGLGGSGLGGSGYGEGMNSPGLGAAAAAAAEQVCERWRKRGNEAYAKGDFVKAEEFYSLGAGSVSPHETSESCIRASMLCYSNRAATRMVVGRMREALADCRHAMAVDPSFVRVHFRAAGCHLALGEIELAAAAYKECVRQAQEASKVDSKVLADASEGLKKVQLIVEYTNQVRNLVHSNLSADLVSALRLLNEALLASPQSELLLELKAYALISLQRYTEAVQVCEQSLALAERNFAALEGNKSGIPPLSWRRRMTAKANFHLGKLEEASEQLQQLQEGLSSMFSPHPDSLGALSAEMALPSFAVIKDLLRHKQEGNNAFQAGKYTEALEHYTAALARNGESRPFCAVCLCNRAAASQALGHVADAIADCSRAIALDSRYAKAISRRAALLEKVRDYGQSCYDLGRLIAIYERQQPQVQGVRSPRVDGLAGPTASGIEELQQAKERLMKAEEEMKKGFPLDHYSILGLELGCSASEIKKAYRRAALRHHPDKAGQFLMRSGDTEDPLKDTLDETVKKEGERLIDEVRKDSEQLFKLIGEAYAVLSDPAKRARYDSEEELRKLRTRSSELAKNVYGDRKHTRSSDFGQQKGGWNTAGEPGSQSRANRQRDRWGGFNNQYQRWHPGPDAAQPDVYARRGRPASSTYGSSHRSTSWRWEEYPWDEV